MKYILNIKKNNISKSWDINSCGEGAVYKCVTPGWTGSRYYFKVKGSEHQTSKVKTLATVDVERMNSVKEFCESVVTENRLKQGIEYLHEQQLAADVKNMGVFLKWVMGDIFKEERDTIEASGLSDHEIAKVANGIAKTWLIKNQDPA